MKLAILAMILVVPAMYAGSVVYSHFDLSVEYIGEEARPMWLITDEKGCLHVYTDISQQEDWKVLSQKGWKIVSPGNLYSYYFGVAGQFNYKKIQTTDFHAWLKEISGRCECPPPETCTRQDSFPWVSVWHSSPTNKGFERGVKITLCHPLTELQIEEVRKLILERLTN